MLYYVEDPLKRASCNLASKDYTPAYIPAMLAFMGVTGKPIHPEMLPILSKEDVVLIGADLPVTLENCKAVAILMGVASGENAPEPSRCRHIYGEYLTAAGDALPIFAPLLSAPAADEVLAYAVQNGEKVPALIRRGKNYEFLFDLPASLWYSGDGFMQVQNEPYFAVGRSTDWCPLPAGVRGEKPFNDLLLLELEKILRLLGIPSVYRLPPVEDGTVPDFVMNFSGDDDCSSADLNRNGAIRMKEAGFPYHINAMANREGKFVFDREVLRELQQNDCELGLHLNLTNVPYTAETVKKQFNQFCEAFGIHPVTNVNHCLVQDGTQAEFLRWLQMCGIIADNGYLGFVDIANINAFDLQDFGYGTSFPRFTCDDAAHGNVLLETMRIPITYYEARLYEEDSDPSKVIGYLDAAAENARVTQFFFHPHYLDESTHEGAAAWRVLALIKKHIEEKGYQPLLMTTNTIAAFWQARSKVSAVRMGNRIAVETLVPILLRLPIASDEVLLDGKPIRVVQKCVEGDTAYLVAVPAGIHELVV